MLGPFVLKTNNPNLFISIFMVCTFEFYRESIIGSFITWAQNSLASDWLLVSRTSPLILNTYQINVKI